MVVRVLKIKKCTQLVNGIGSPKAGMGNMRAGVNAGFWMTFLSAI